jgi:hypothetical protein
MTTCGIIFWAPGQAIPSRRGVMRYGSFPRKEQARRKELNPSYPWRGTSSKMGYYVQVHVTELMVH